MLFRELRKNEIEIALELVWKTFLEYEAVDYTEEGLKEFYNSIHHPHYLSLIRCYGAFDEEKIVGVIATRNEGNHIALFFVDGKYQRKGIGRKLFKLATRDNLSGKMTVNASRFGVEVYHHLGFSDTDSERVVNGLRYTPMEILLEK